MSLFSSAGTNVSDSRVGASDQATAIGSKAVVASGSAINFGKINTGDQSLNFPGDTAGRGGSGGVKNGDVSFNIVTNDPGTALAALQSNENTTANALSKQQEIALQANQAISGVANKAQQTAESTLLSSIDAIKDVALPAGEKTAQTYAYLVAGAVIILGGGYIYFKFKKRS